MRALVVWYVACDVTPLFAQDIVRMLCCLEHLPNVTGYDMWCQHLRATIKLLRQVLRALGLRQGKEIYVYAIGMPTLRVSTDQDKDKKEAEPELLNYFMKRGWRFLSKERTR